MNGNEELNVASDRTKLGFMVGAITNAIKMKKELSKSTEFGSSLSEAIQICDLVH